MGRGRVVTGAPCWPSMVSGGAPPGSCTEQIEPSAWPSSKHAGTPSCATWLGVGVGVGGKVRVRVRVTVRVGSSRATIVLAVTRGAEGSAADGQALARLRG